MHRKNNSQCACSRHTLLQLIVESSWCVVRVAMFLKFILNIRRFPCFSGVKQCISRKGYRGVCSFDCPLKIWQEKCCEKFELMSEANASMAVTEVTELLRSSRRKSKCQLKILYTSGNLFFEYLFAKYILPLLSI